MSGILRLERNHSRIIIEHFVKIRLCYGIHFRKTDFPREPILCNIFPVHSLGTFFINLYSCYKVEFIQRINLDATHFFVF